MDNKRLLNTFLDLVKIYSPSKNEINVLNYIKDRLDKLKIKYILHDHCSDYGGNTPVLIAKLDKNEKGKNLKKISLCAHMDVVEPCFEVKPYIEDGLVKTKSNTTLGADDKAGVSCILEILETLIKENLAHNDIFAIFTPSEEIGLLGAKSIKWNEISKEFLPVKDMIVLDNANGVDEVAMQGPCMYVIDVTFKGLSSHAGIEPEKGKNALFAMCKAISKMKIGRLNDHTTSNVGSIISNFPTNVVPNECKIKMELRCLDEKEAKDNLDNYIEIFKSTAKEFDIECKIDVEYDYPPLKQIDNGVLLKNVLKAYKNIGIDAKGIKIGGGCDANIFLKDGFNSVAVGVGMYKMHTTDEYLVISDMENTTKAMLNYICKD
ncbi:hypothetical protein HMPREF3188_00467 [Tissierellia bacterium KA00581]|jgi:hypothetical protein|nr:hypothetical protein HMPREF3188_00467 [Tissierellia bacterium KA00581]